MKCATIQFSSYQESVFKVFDKIGAKDVLAKESKILIKPNLINDSPHPVTTPVACCEAILNYIRICSKADIVIAEGCGDPVLETEEIFNRLGYRKLAKKYGITLVDLNDSTAQLRKLQNPVCPFFPEIYLPEIAFTHFIISVPVLKAHSLAMLTGTLKNMMGFAPPKHYSGKFGSWKKAAFHGDLHQTIIDLNQYRTPELSLMDASVGLADYHLGGRHCEPPVGKLIAGFNPVEVDRKAAELLELDWRKIGHLML